MTTATPKTRSVRRLEAQPTPFQFTYNLNTDDVTMILAFCAWDRVNGYRSPRRDEIDCGFGDHRFPSWGDSTGTRAIDRLVLLGIVRKVSKGLWLSAEGYALAMEIDRAHQKETGKSL